jgi:CID domain
MSRPAPVGDGHSISRQRLHLIYVLNDIFHHARHHATDSSSKDAAAPFLPVLPDLFRHAASEQKGSTCKRLSDLIEIWQCNQYIPTDVVEQINAAIIDPKSVAAGPASELPHKAQTASKGLAYIMPSMHGDPSLPFYELPAGNLMPHIVPKRRTSIRPDSIRPLLFAAGPADEGLVNAVKDFLREIEHVDDAYAIEEKDLVADIDDLGQLFYRNEAGEVTGETYYGWSKEFCDRMKSRRNQKTNGSAQRSRSRCYSSSRSPSPSRKRRCSHSSSDRSRSRSRHRNRRSPDERLTSRSPRPMPYSMPAVNLNLPKLGHGQTTYQHGSSLGIARGDLYANTGYPTFQPPPLMPGNLPVPPPRPPNWPAGSPWPPPPPPSAAIGSTGFPHPPFPPPPNFSASPRVPGFSKSNRPPRYQGR